MIDIVPFSLKDAPSLIERAWPTSKISEEVQKEANAGSGQTLTGLSSYWKGRKRLIHIRSCLIASLMPVKVDATPDDIAEDVAIFERIMAFDEQAMRLRLPTKKHDLLAGTYRDQVLAAKRPEEMDQDRLLAGIWGDVNGHLGTNAHSVPELVEQLGIMRFGRRPKVADTFCGSGSIPFEAARIGCDVYASDLNPVACMLTWGSFNVVGASEDEDTRMRTIQDKVLQNIEDEIASLGIEHDAEGNRAKVFLYCLETRCPRTGYMVPMTPSWVVSKKRNTIARLVPDHVNKRYDIEIITGVTDAEVANAANGTVRSGRLHHPVLEDDLGIPIKEIRGDHKKNDGGNRNRLRLWEKCDFMPRPDDIWQERLYCIQWMNGADVATGKGNPRTWFAAPNADDLTREGKVKSIVDENLADWQNAGFIPDMQIEPGYNTSQPIRERGWTYWHHLFGPRQLLSAVLWSKRCTTPYEYMRLLKALDFNSRACFWQVNSEACANVFTNQALNTMLNYPCRAFRYFYNVSGVSRRSAVYGTPQVYNHAADDIRGQHDIIITDPPYADAVQYDEITEFFIAWLRKNPPAPFDQWIWDSRRAIAIKGSDHGFKMGMIKAYKAMTDHLSDNGLQIVQFTHQDNRVWADMAQIFWGCGLQVVQDWVISTEKQSDLKKGGYVQGTHNIVCRKRQRPRSGYSDEIYHEIEDAVRDQVAQMIGLNQHYTGTGTPNIFSDDDISTAGYAAALRVLTSYTRIDGDDMVAAAMRPRQKGQKTIVDQLVDHAAKVAAQALVPEGIQQSHWSSFNNGERFYLKMIEMESRGQVKLDLFQRFATAYGIVDKDFYMARARPNEAAMKSAGQIGRNGLDHAEFGKTSTVRLVLRAIDRIERGHDAHDVIGELRDLVPDYLRKHAVLVALTGFIAERRGVNHPAEASAARILRTALQNARV